MQCATIGELRTFLDGELGDVDEARVEQHLALCVSCRQELEALRANASVAGLAFGGESPAVPRVAWSRIRERAKDRGGRSVTIGWRMSEMFGNLWRLAAGSKVGMATSTAAVLIAVALLFTLTPVQIAASSFLSIFRVNKFVAVTVDPSSLPKVAAPQDLGTFTNSGKTNSRQVASLTEASKVVGFQVMTPTSLPAGLQAQPRSTMVTDGQNVTFVPDLKKVRAYLNSIGAGSVKLPDNLDGAQISIQVQPAVAVLYTEPGGVERTSDGTVKPNVGQKYLYLGATTSPTLNVPDGLNVEQIRQQLLQMPGLPPDLVNQLQAINDWQHTVVVPVVQGKSREVTVQGNKGLLITDQMGQGATLLWLNGSTIYTLTASVSESELLAAANSMK